MPAATTVTTIERLGDHVGQTVTLRGWIYNRTSKGKLHFVLLRDGTGIAQCVVFKGGVPEELFEAVGAAGQESSLVLTGEVKADARAPGGFELGVSEGQVLQSVEEYPITPKGTNRAFCGYHRSYRSAPTYMNVRHNCHMTKYKRKVSDIF